MEKVNNQELGKRIYQLRKAAGHTQDDLAALLKQKRQVISYYENGTRTPSVEQLMTIAKEYNTTTDYLLGLTKPKTNDNDLRFVCEYTGLSENTIVSLLYQQAIKNQTGQNDFIDFLEYLIDIVSQNSLFANDFCTMRKYSTYYAEILIKFDEYFNNQKSSKNMSFSNLTNAEEVKYCVGLLEAIDTAKNLVAIGTLNAEEIEEPELLKMQEIMRSYGIFESSEENIEEQLNELVGIVDESRNYAGSSKYTVIKHLNAVIDEFCVSKIESLSASALEHIENECYKRGLII